MTDPPRTPLLEVHRITKRFPGVLALQRVNLTLFPGEVLAVVGENGAGKSTLMKLLAGVDAADEGEIRVEGKPVVIQSVHDALELGIALIHQELNLCDNLDVAANIFLGREPRRWGLVDRSRMIRDSQRFMAMVGLDLSPRTLVRQLPIGHQQMVEIAKALSVDARVLIMDEPTSSLSQRETDALFDVVRRLKAQGVSIVYISHRLGEVRELADRVLVLRDGRNAGELARREIDHDRIVKLMVGRDVSQFYSRQGHVYGPPLLEVERLAVPAHPRYPLSFAVRQREIVGVAGLVGAGRTEMLRALFGIDRPLAGSIRVAGRRLREHTPREAIRAGMALVPEDRKEQGLVLDMSLQENVSLAALRFHQRPGGMLNQRAERRDAQRAVRELKIRTPSLQQVTRYLSGGNQQKVVLSKWLALNPRVLLLDEPTRGIDVGAKREIYRLIDELAGQGMAILFVSSEMEEILGLSDRALVMHEGRIAGQLERSQLSEEAVMRLATGQTTTNQPAPPDDADQPAPASSEFSH